MSRFAAQMPVLYFEESVRAEGDRSSYDLRSERDGAVWVVTPAVPDGWDEAQRLQALAGILDECLAQFGAENPLFWFYTPLMRAFTAHIEAAAIVYDCMDELANFDHASPTLPACERELMHSADVMFTGGHSLFESKRRFHSNVHCFPSAVDANHFAKARQALPEPADQANIPHPRLGFFGVIDERFDVDLIGKLAETHPEWSFVLIGPVVKIDPAKLPKPANIHYLDIKSYAQLPHYLSGWDIALMPFALNDATRFISPTKTPEYLAGGKPVVTTPIADVVRQYGDFATVSIAAGVEDFGKACSETLARQASYEIAFADTDAFLAKTSWDGVFSKMSDLVQAAVARRRAQKSRGPFVKRQIFDALVVGAGFAGAVMAERLAADGDRRVLVVDRRPHIGGNAYDYVDAAGIQVHAYGPHIFHTNSAEVFRYLSRFTDWRPYEHRVLASVAGKLVPIPINRQTLNEVFDLSLQTDEEAAQFLARRAEPRSPIETSEDVVVNAVGRELYEMFFRGYTRKQWGVDPSALNRSVTARIPTRTSLDDRYFTDFYQAMPKSGYTAMFQRMLDHPNITVELGVDRDDIRNYTAAPLTVYTGAIDAFYKHRFGHLPYRSLRFEHRTLDESRHQPVATVNYPDEKTPYTRVTEFKHMTGQTHVKTSIVLEYPASEGDPYYPVPQVQNEVLYRRYETLAAREANVLFVGRLATYRYYNMDQIIGQALATYRRLKMPAFKTSHPAEDMIAAQ